MSDLRALMDEAAGPPQPPTASVVADADLARGRHALRRRRVRRAGIGSGLVTVAVLGAFAIVTPGALPGSTNPGISVASTSLVSYTGKQPVGFILDKVPAGWEIAASDPGHLLLAPVGTEIQPSKSISPGSPESGSAFSEAVSLKGKIAVQLQRPGMPAELAPTSIKVRVNDQPATIATMRGGDGTRTLYLKQRPRAYLTIQVWGGLGWSNDQIVEFASAIHVTKDAEYTVG